MMYTSAEIADIGGWTVTFAPSGFWAYYQTCNATMYLNAHQALVLADEIIARYKDLRTQPTWDAAPGTVIAVEPKPKKRGR